MLVAGRLLNPTSGTNKYLSFKMLLLCYGVMKLSVGIGLCIGGFIFVCVFFSFLLVELDGLGSLQSKMQFKGISSLILLKNKTKSCHMA